MKVLYKVKDHYEAEYTGVKRYVDKEHCVIIYFDTLQELILPYENLLYISFSPESEEES